MLGNGGASGSVIGNIAFCANASDPSCDPSTNKVLAFNRSDVFTFGGSITGPGQVLQVGSGATILSGVSTYTGPTLVDAGTLIVTGSITSQVTVNSGGVLSGSGAVGSVTINGGGLLAPANPGGVLTVQGDLLFATAGAYLVEIRSTAADRVNVTGTCDAGRQLLVSLQSGTSILKQYTILNATGGVTGTFAGVNNLPASVAAKPELRRQRRLSQFVAELCALGGALNTNQQNVGNALASFFNSTGSIPVVYATLSPAALSQIAGETATGSQQTTFQAMSQFITTVARSLHRWARRRSAAGNGGDALCAKKVAPAPDAAAAKRRSQSERAAYAMMYRKAPLREIYDPHWSVWASGFGGSQTTDGSTATGSNSVTSRIFGVRPAPTICCRRAPSPASRWPAAAPISASPIRAAAAPIYSRPAPSFATRWARPISPGRWPMAGRTSPPTASS